MSAKALLADCLAGGAALRVLALGHEASLSGAALMHLHWLEWAARKPARVSLKTVTVRGGPLATKWPQNIPSELLVPDARPWIVRIIDRPRFVKRRFAECMSRYNPAWPDVVLVNTLTLGWLFPCLAKFTCPIVIHAHELAGSTNRFTLERDRDLMRRMTARWIAVSEAVRTHLVQDLKVSESSISVVRNFAPPRIDGLDSGSLSKAQLASSNGLNPEEPWIVAVGNLSAIKAPELFLAMAPLVRTAIGAVTFIWVGGGLGTKYGRKLQRLNRKAQVYFVDRCADPTPWLKAARILVVTSVEESSSLVTLEAAQVRTPTIAVSGTGGIDEFLKEGAGFLVRNRNAETLAETIISLLKNPAELDAAGSRAARRVADENDYEKQCELLTTVLEQTAAERSR